MSVCLADRCTWVCRLPVHTITFAVRTCPILSRRMTERGKERERWRTSWRFCLIVLSTHDVITMASSFALCEKKSNQKRFTFLSLQGKQHMWIILECRWRHKRSLSARWTNARIEALQQQTATVGGRIFPTDVQLLSEEGYSRVCEHEILNKSITFFHSKQHKDNWFCQKNT